MHNDTVTSNAQARSRKHNRVVINIDELGSKHAKQENSKAAPTMRVQSSPAFDP